MERDGVWILSETARDSPKIARYTLETARDTLETTRESRLSEEASYSQKAAGRGSLQTATDSLVIIRDIPENSRLSGGCQTLWRQLDTLEKLWRLIETLWRCLDILWRLSDSRDSRDHQRHSGNGQTII